MYRPTAFALTALLFVGDLAAQSTTDEVVKAARRWLDDYRRGAIELLDERLDPPRFGSDPTMPRTGLDGLKRARQVCDDLVKASSSEAAALLAEYGELVKGRDWRWDLARLDTVLRQALRTHATAPLTSALVALASDTKLAPARRGGALAALEYANHEAAAEAALTLTADREPSVRRAIASCAQNMGLTPAVSHLVMAMQFEADDATLGAFASALIVLMARGGTPGSVERCARAAATALPRAKSPLVAARMVQLLDEHRAPDAVPALIDLLERTATVTPTSASHGRALRDLRADALRALRDMTGAVLGIDQLAAWRQLGADPGKLTIRPKAPSPRGASGERTVARSSGTPGRFYGVPVTGRRVVFVVDGSGSMEQPIAGGHGLEPKFKVQGPTRYEVACREVAAAIDALGPDAAFGVVVFANEATALDQQLRRADADGKRNVAWFLQNGGRGASTNLWAGLELALNMTFPRGDGTSDPVDEIFLLSDGQPTCGELSTSGEIVSAALARNRRIGARIHTVAIGAAGEGLLRALAKQTDGEFTK